MGIPVAVISAIYDLPLNTGASRVVKGAKIEHVCGDPSLGERKDFDYGVRITRSAVTALKTAVDKPTLFDPADMLATTKEMSHAS
jgi:glycine reductase complex component B subunit gamma